MTVEFVPENLRNLIQEQDSLTRDNNNLNKLHDSVQNFCKDPVICGSGPAVLVDPGGLIQTPDNCEEDILMEIPDNVTEQPASVRVDGHLEQILSFKCVRCLWSLLSRLKLNRSFKVKFFIPDLFCVFWFIIFMFSDIWNKLDDQS